ncbi:MAG: hypothetical protein G01um101433_685 [Parcubacteria group bacterium Gr01-1014_33]|nr:MAG: hypothetical protein G01um101433_685 [Parcubacteria group bacterium Gr01-1014_33]
MAHAQKAKSRKTAKRTAVKTKARSGMSRRHAAARKEKRGKRRTLRNVGGVLGKQGIQRGGKKEEESFAVARAQENPIIAPMGKNDWEAWQTFNPGVILLDDKIHFLYRAIGTDGISRLGYAVSNDGFSIRERMPHPVYQHAMTHYSFNIHSYLSGGGWGGCEDPRLTLIGDTIYMAYVACDQGLPQLSLTSISKKDFLERNWKWSAPKNISPPGMIVKSGCLFPETIKGKHVILYRIFPDIWIDARDTFDFPNGAHLEGAPEIKIRPRFWDSRKIGPGAPPIKTKYGWLLIYYGVDERDSSRYKMGAMLLDKDNPAKVVYRSRQPILEPDEWYENEGHKAGIVYPCGAVVKNGELLIYYGAADSFVCVASADLDEFLESMTHERTPRIKVNRVRK